MELPYGSLLGGLGREGPQVDPIVHTVLTENTDMYKLSLKRFKRLAGRIAWWIKRWTTGRKVLGSILASTTKGAQHERLIVSPCEIIKIC
jgi:hypothetical protein